MYEDKNIRHKKQQMHEGSFSLENKLMDYLRNNYSPAAVCNTTTQQTIKQDLIHQAKKIDLTSHKQEDLNKDYATIVDNTIKQYVTNQAKPKYKRANQLGKQQQGTDTYNNISRTLSQLRY